jgi:hypothetical protein
MDLPKEPPCRLVNGALVLVAADHVVGMAHGLHGRGHLPPLVLPVLWKKH